MIDPEYTCNYSLIDNKVQIHGNLEFASWLSSFIREKCINDCDLYEAQELIRKYCVSTFSQDFYIKNAEAINFIIENEYCHKERERLPVFDMQRYKQDLLEGALY